MVTKPLGTLRSESSLLYNIHYPRKKRRVPGIGLEKLKSMVEDPTYEEVELVHAEVRRLASRKCEARSGGDESGDGGGERGLVEGLVGVSETEEENIPDLEESGGGEEAATAIAQGGLGRGEELGDGGKRRRRRREMRGGEREGHGGWDSGFALCSLTEYALNSCCKFTRRRGEEERRREGRRRSGEGKRGGTGASQRADD